MRDANFDQLRRPGTPLPHHFTKTEKPKAPPQGCSSQPLSLENPPLCAYFSMPENKISKNTMKNQCLALCIWKYVELHVCTRGGSADADTLFFGDALKPLYISLFYCKSFWLAFWKCAFAKIQRLPKSYKSLWFRFRRENQDISN